MNQELLYGQWESYTDLYNYIFQERLFLDEWFDIPGTEERIRIADIKAKAFEEVYPYLPTKSERQFLIDKIHDIKPGLLAEIIKELPAK